MLVYSDIERSEDREAVAVEIEDRLTRCQKLPAGLERHQALVAAFIRAGELLQGVADAEFARCGSDTVSEAQDAGGTLLLALAGAVMASWDDSFMPMPARLDDVAESLTALAGDRGSTIRTRQPEGYGFYALYPECYGVAARQSGLGPQTTVIGIRSIGTSLAAVVAAALGATAAHTLRPVGHPFQRRLAVDASLRDRLVSGEGDFAIVDEGPGFSGSSFNCVADWLVENGIAEDRIHFFPGHDGQLGEVASPAHRQRWTKAARHVAAFDPVMLDAPDQRQRLDHWVATKVGPLEGPLTDVSGGGWRELWSQPADTWPPVDAAGEKRKFIAKADGKLWLVKFAGVGASGEARLALSKALSAAGFAPEPMGLCHGFLVLPWIKPTTSADRFPPKARILDYLAFRASLPAERPDAGLAALCEMATHNFRTYFGDDAASALRRALGDPQRFRPTPCCTDNRLHRWEWLQSGERWLKLDGADHHAGHDLIGCQDIAWDVAGAAVEFDMDEGERNALAEGLSRRIGREVPSAYVAMNELCYLGFQIGFWSMALGRAQSLERQRITDQLRHYEHHRAVRKLRH